MRIFALALAFSCLAAAQPKLAFEVVAINPIPQPTPQTIRDGTSFIGMKIEGGRVEIGGYTPAALVSRAFRVNSKQVVAPDFAGGPYFDIQAKLPEGANADQVPEMLQTMLEERFKLAYHHETRDYTMSVLTVGKNGMKLPRLPDDTPRSAKATPLPEGGLHMVEVGPISILFAVMNSFGGLQMADETGLTGIYSWVRDQRPGRPGMTYPEVVQEAFGAMIDAAGLKLETRKVAMDTVVVDHLEKAPTEN